MHLDHSWPKGGEQIAFKLMDFYSDWITGLTWDFSVVLCAAEQT